MNMYVCSLFVRSYPCDIHVYSMYGSHEFTREIRKGGRYQLNEKLIMESLISMSTYYMIKEGCGKLMNFNIIPLTYCYSFMSY